MSNMFVHKINKLKEQIESELPEEIEATRTARLIAFASEVFDEIDYLQKRINDSMDRIYDMKNDFSYEYEYVMSSLFFPDEEIDKSNKSDLKTQNCYVYYILNQEKDKVKIGVSNNPTGRAKQLQTASGEDIELLHTILFSSRKDALEAETFLHNLFGQERKRPSKVSRSCEWFDSKIVNILMKYFTDADEIKKLERTSFRIILGDLIIDEEAI